MNYEIIVASIVTWRSYFDHSYYQIHFTLFCCQFIFVEIYAPILRGGSVRPISPFCCLFSVYRGI